MSTEPRDNQCDEIHAGVKRKGGTRLGRHSHIMHVDNHPQRVRNLLQFLLPVKR